MKTTNTITEKTTYSNFEMANTTKRMNWNNRRRYAVLTQFKFI